MTSDDLINHKLGKGQYEIRAVLGRGGMASVYSARQASMNRDVAIKVMTPELAEDDQFVSRFEHEAKLIAQLQHPHILPVIDFGREGKHIFIVMQLVRGGSLDDRLHEGPLPLRLASRMLTQIGSALTFAHEQGIIHRDLKPNNVMLDERNNAYLVDFGIAKMLAGTTKLTATGNILGTPAYMAPEQWRGDPVDARTDIYSLGIMVYEMVLGRLPFTGDTPFTLMYKHFNDPPPAPRAVNPDIEPSIEAVILRALAKDPDDRYQSADQLAEDFARAVASLPTGLAPRPKPVPDDRTIIGDEVAPAARTTPPPGETILPDRPGTPKATPRTAFAPDAQAAPGLRPAAPTTGVAAAPPARRGMNPLVIGGAVIGVIAVIVIAALVLTSGGDNGKKVVIQPTSTETATPTDTPTATDTPTDTPTPTPRTTSATILAERANVRRGPSTDFDVIGTVARDDEVIVLGISEDGAWYEVAIPGMGSGWVSAEIVRISGNTNIPVIVLPTKTPTPTDSPTPTDTPTETPTDTPTATPTPEFTPTEKPTETPPPESTATEAPTATPVSGTIDPALFVPTEFTTMTLDNLGLTFDYPANWPSPQGTGALQLISAVDASDPLYNSYPSIALARGTPNDIKASGLTSHIADPVDAVEHPFDVDFSGTSQAVTGYNYPAYQFDSNEGELRAVGLIFVISDTDWLDLFSVFPSGQYDQDFVDQVLARMIRTMTIDGQPLVPVAENTQALTALPLQLGSPTLDRFADNTNNWQFGDIANGELYIEATDKDFFRWTFPNDLINGDPAYYAQVTGKLSSDTDYYQIGLAFRVVDGNNFYYFVVNHAQQYGLYSITDGNLVTLIDATVDPSIKTGKDAPNTVGVLVMGDYIEVYVNGQFKGAVVDHAQATGGARPVTYTYVDSNSPVGASFDDYAYLPLTITGSPDLNDQGIATVARATSGGSTVLVSPQAGAEVLVSLDADQPFVALARSANSAFIYGYGHGATGWVPVDSISLEHNGTTVTPQTLPILDSGSRGEKVAVWPVIWPEDTTSQNTPPAGQPAIHVGQTLSSTINEGESTTWQFGGSQGAVVTFAATSDPASDLDLKMTVFGPENENLISNDDDGPGLDPLIQNFTLPANGIYTIQIDALSGSGSYDLSLTKGN